MVSNEKIAVSSGKTVSCLWRNISFIQISGGSLNLLLYLHSTYKIT